MDDARRITTTRPEAATDAGRFLAKRGHVVMKQFRDIGEIECNHGDTLKFSTLLFATAQGTRGERTFGIKIEHESESGEESCLMDFIELKEFLLAIKHLIGLAKQTHGTVSDYTEFQYVTKDSLKVGFYEDTKGQQQAFIDVSPGGDMSFLELDALRQVFEIIKRGREYLIEKGANEDSQSPEAP